nr:nudix hydrolase 2-like [Ipomoea batatas]GME11953.1 nudix hydrolase 2-like [Ipomoea batatas]
MKGGFSSKFRLKKPRESQRGPSQRRRRFLFLWLFFVAIGFIWLLISSSYGRLGRKVEAPPHLDGDTTNFLLQHFNVSRDEIHSLPSYFLDTDQENMEILEATDDAYGGVIVDMKKKMDSATFVALLRASISQWKQEGKRGVWLKLPIELSSVVDAAVKEGFWYHHAEATYLMMVYWIPESTPNTFPPNASHRVGVGAFVINQKGEILVVQENSGKFAGTGIWKMPTGVVEEGEDIWAAAVREVQEETGIDTEFVELLAFRQSHNSFFGKSDLFFVCMLRPLSFTIKKQDSEIKAAQWMSIEEYAAQPFVQEHEIFNSIAKICLARKENAYSGFSALLNTSGFSKKKSYLYCSSTYTPS